VWQLSQLFSHFLPGIDPSSSFGRNANGNAFDILSSFVSIIASDDDDEDNCETDVEITGATKALVEPT
jgi:hypothetical protein